MSSGDLREFSLSWNDKVNAGAKTCKMHVSQPMNIDTMIKSK
ncbi:MAG: hypothetical protein QM751_05930 [Paludibacteraceae bacterium]